ncbi:hypothetical protein B0I35DRAFT_447350 [Stachybotrys elegans]|uniref:Uncharacterized protein n=1 Tax=Stachybotrys elegans TaxID=80388 RepID=A0A8K0WID5_9HYPO|nr:hypothetical protein B0I35DRAFT_447350 [Stachybotrys elegans]
MVDAIVQELMFLPFDTESKLLRIVEELLEQACFAYGRATMADMMQRKGWKCASMVHLSEWAGILRVRRNDMKTTIDEDNYEVILRAMKEIRGVLVERTPVDTVKLDELLLSSCKLVKMLGQTEYVRGITWLHQQVHEAISTLGLDVEPFYTKARGVHREIQEQRVKLKIQEEQNREELRSVQERLEELAAKNVDMLLAEFRKRY